MWKLSWYAALNTTDQVNLAMTSGEDIDLLNYNSCGGLDTMYVTLGPPRWTTLWKNMDRAL